MEKKVFIVSATPRKNGNSEILANAFARGAAAAGHSVDRIDLRETELKFCIGCLRCQTQGRCVLSDGMNELYARIQAADILAFATPVYFYEMAGQLKTFLDRLNPLYPRQNRFREAYLLAAAAEADEAAMDGAVRGLQGWIDCFEGVRLAGVVRGTGVTDAGEITGADAVDQAYAMGRGV